MERLIARHAAHVTTLEMDPIVVRGSLEYFDDFNLMSSLPNRTIVIDNPEHYVTATTTQYDMLSIGVFIADDTTAFYAALANRLAPGGLLVASLAGDFATNSHISRQRVESLAAVSNEVMILTPATINNSVAYAADKLPLPAMGFWLRYERREKRSSPYSLPCWFGP